LGQGLNICTIDKGRAEKKKLTQRTNKQLNPLISQFERYRKVFEALNLPFNWDFKNIFNVSNKPIQQENWLGIAPFSQHQGKTYPLSNIEKIIAHFHEKKIKIFLLGSAKDRIKIHRLQEKYPYIIPLIDLALDQLLEKMQKMKVILSMDSANLHFASLINKPVVSIWGATHPYLGFYGWGQAWENIVQKKIDCAPCSTFGNKPCFRKDYACLKELSAETVIQKLTLFIQ
jgi:ADP-heptose:LPS heptosyltransferase